MKVLEEATNDELRWLIMELTECTPISFKEIETRLEEIRALFLMKVSPFRFRI